MKKKIFSAILVGMLLSLCACKAMTPAEKSDSADGGAEESTRTFEQTEMSENNLENSIKVTDMVALDKADSNVMFSPTSLNYALGMLQLGAAGEIKDRLSEYLGTDDYAAYAKAYLDFAQEYSADYESDGDYKTKLSLADSLWTDQTISLQQDYVENVEKQFDAGSQSLNFKDPESADVINDWIKEKTENMIDQVISADALQQSKVVLVNTVYFESPWIEPWDLGSAQEDFSKTDGTTEQITYMYGQANSYYENDQATAFGYSYGNGMEFVGILPKTEGEFTLESLDLSGLLQSEDTDVDEIDCKMPRLDFETDMDLNEELKALGLEGMFDGSGDFSAMADDLQVSGVIQKTKLELDENGTRASAATVLMMLTGAMPDVKLVTKEVYLDRPFAFLIYDKNHNEVLFMGKVVNVEE